MSLLTPLYVLGMLAVSAPLLFHLIRRSPKGQVWFSSLMFLSPSPPRLTRRSRLDNILLLLLRATALCLLAFAFARPFLLQAATTDRDSTAERRIAVLIDTSASMRRDGVWQRAIAEAQTVLDEARPDDEVAIYAFDSTLRPVLSFDELVDIPIDQRPVIAKSRLAGLAPTWGSTNLDQALIDAVGAVNDAVDATEEASHRARRIVLITDYQAGSRLEALGGFEWPSDVKLDTPVIIEGDEANAGLRSMADPVEFAEVDAEPEMRIQVMNDPGSPNERFQLTWRSGQNPNADAETNAQASAAQSSAAQSAVQPVEVYVPPGESRVVRVPYPPEELANPVLRLSGDRHDYDNTLHFAADRKNELAVHYVGPDAIEDKTGLQFFLANAFVDTPRQTVAVTGQTPAEPIILDESRPPNLIVVTTETSPENQQRLASYIASGGTVAYVMNAAGSVGTLATLAGVDEVSAETGDVGNYVMLKDIEFSHPLFAALAAPQFNDFTKIHFWDYRRLNDAALGPLVTADNSNPDGVRIVARFENGDPAVLEKKLGQGHLIVLTSGWQPADSQFALSTKFVPFMAAMLDRQGDARVDTSAYFVGDRIPLEAVGNTDADSPDSLRKWSVTKPNGDQFEVPEGLASFSETDEPGMYTLSSGDERRLVAVNMNPAESRTATLPVEDLQTLGVKTTTAEIEAADRERMRQMRDVELESRQKMWQWIVLAVIGVLILETWLAGKLGRQNQQAHAEASP